MNKRPTLILSYAMLCLVGSAWAAEPVPYELRDVGITEHVGTPLPLDLAFTDETGETVALRSYVNGTKPIMLILAYYECPMLCGLLLNGFTEGLRDLAWTPGKEFEVVTISIDPTETPALAAGKKAAILEGYGRPDAAAGWHFLTGNAENIRALAEAVGFQYRFDAASQEYAHAAAVTVLSPQGKVMRYLYGIQYRLTDLRMALVEAGQGKVGSVVDRILMLCYRYDPRGRKYSLFATNLMKSAAGITIVGIGGGIWLMSRRRRWV